MKTVFSATSLREPRDFFEDPMLGFKLPYAEMVRRFGEPHRQMEADDNEPGPCVYWDFAFESGIAAHLVYHEAYEFVEVFSDQPEIDHLISCLGISRNDGVWRLDDSDGDEFKRRFGREAWVLERQDDHGNKNVVENFKSEKLANIVKAKFEAMPHKQTYFVQRADQGLKNDRGFVNAPPPSSPPP